MRLFELDDKIEHVLSEGTDRATGEISDEALNLLTALEMERDAKALAVARYAMGELAEGEAVQTQADRLAKRAKIHKRRYERLKGYIAAHLPPGTKLADDVVQLGWRKSEACIVVDEKKVPGQFQKISYSIDKAAAKAALKAGEKVPGCELLVKQNLQVK